MEDMRFTTKSGATLEVLVRPSTFGGEALKRYIMTLRTKKSGIVEGEDVEVLLDVNSTDPFYFIRKFIERY